MNGLRPSPRCPDAAAGAHRRNSHSGMNWLRPTPLCPEGVSGAPNSNHPGMNGLRPAPRCSEEVSARRATAHGGGGVGAEPTRIRGRAGGLPSEYEVAGLTAGGDPRLTLTVDLDGVICAPPARFNLGVGRRFLDPDAPPVAARVPPHWLSAPLDRLRFDFRRPLPEARDALAALSELRRLVVLTGRRTSPLRWMEHHGLDRYVDEIVVNDGPLASAHFKLRTVEELGAAEHIDDDGPTAQLLAERSKVAVYVRDWPRNRGLPYAPNVTRVANLGELARRLGGSRVDET